MPFEPHPRRLLPPEAEMDRDDALDAFLVVLNTVRPDHPYFDDPYPVDRDGVDYGVTRRAYARCGPRRRWAVVVHYATRLTYINRVSRERHLALLTHEITHIPFNNRSGSQHGSHAPEFWREMAFHATEVRDALREGKLDDVFGGVDVDGYLRAVANDAANGATVDERYWSTDECQAEVSRLIGLGDA